MYTVCIIDVLYYYMYVLKINLICVFFATWLESGKNVATLNNISVSHHLQQVTMCTNIDVDHHMYCTCIVLGVLINGLPCNGVVLIHAQCAHHFLLRFPFHFSVPLALQPTTVKIASTTTCR